MESLQPTNPNYNKGTETALDRIRDSYLNEGAEEGLSASDRQRKEELEAAHGLLTQYHSVEQTVPLLMGRFQLSKATAYRRVNETIRLFGDVTRSYKDGIRHLLYEYTMKIFQLALAAKDEFGKPRPDLKAANAAVKNMAVLKGLDKEDSTALTPEMLGDKTYVLQININGGGGTSKSVRLDNLDALDADTYAELVGTVEASDLSLEGMKHLLTEAQEEGEEEDDDDEGTQC